MIHIKTDFFLGSIIVNPSSDLTINSTGGISSLRMSGTIGDLSINSGESTSITFYLMVIISSGFTTGR